MFNGTFHYFDWAIFNSELLVYQRLLGLRNFHIDIDPTSHRFFLVERLVSTKNQGDFQQQMGDDGKKSVIFSYMMDGYMMNQKIGIFRDFQPPEIMGFGNHGF